MNRKARWKVQSDLNVSSLALVRETEEAWVYFVIGSDGNRYGPVPIATLEEWVDQNRIIPQTMLIDATTGISVSAQSIPSLNARFVPQTGYAQNQPHGGPGQSAHTGGYQQPNQSYGSSYNQFQAPPGPNHLSYAHLYGYSSRSKLVAIVLAVLLGPLGIHRFYLGYNGTGLIMLLMTLASPLTCFATAMITCVWAVADIVMIATGSMRDAEGRVLPN